MYAFYLFAFFNIVASRSPPLVDFTPVNEFTLQLLKLTHAHEEDFGTRNFAISPVSIWHIFALLAEGSSGDTFTELDAGLRLPKDPKTTQCLHTAAKSVLTSYTPDVILKGQSYMFTECSTKIHDEFCQAALLYGMSIYSSETTNTTELAHDINLHICLITDGKIINAVKPSDLENLRLMLVDALYFKANWTHPFDFTQTREEAFYNTLGKRIGFVNMMYHKAPHNIGDADEIGAQVLEMTYGNKEEFAMLILLPYEGISLKKVLDNLTTQSQNWMTNFRTDRSMPLIDTFIPRFNLSTKLDLIPVMRYMGITSVFDKKKSKLPGVSDSPLFVSSSLQNVEIEVNEEGTVAASSTVVGLEDRLLRQRFEANKEFAFLIVQRSCNLILFAGVYTAPTLV